MENGIDLERQIHRKSWTKMDKKIEINIEIDKEIEVEIEIPTEIEKKIEIVIYI